MGTLHPASSELRCGFKITSNKFRGIFGQNLLQYVQFEKVPEGAPTAVFYNEGGEEVEKVLLEGLSRCRDVFDPDEEDGVDDVEVKRVLPEGLSRPDCDNQILLDANINFYQSLAGC